MYRPPLAATNQTKDSNAFFVFILHKQKSKKNLFHLSLCVVRYDFFFFLTLILERRWKGETLFHFFFPRFWGGGGGEI